MDEARGDQFLELIIYTNHGSEEDASKAILKGACYVPKGSLSLGGAVTRAVELHSAILGLAKVIDEIASQNPRDDRLLNLAKTAFECILAIRGRR